MPKAGSTPTPAKMPRPYRTAFKQPKFDTKLPIPKNPGAMPNRGLAQPLINPIMPMASPLRKF